MADRVMSFGHELNPYMIFRNVDYFNFWKKKIMKIGQNLTEVEGKRHMSSLYFKAQPSPCHGDHYLIHIRLEMS